MIGFASGTSLEQLNFLGFMGILDPPRPGVEESVRTLLRSGVQVKMITGDSKFTALTIGKDFSLPQLSEVKFSIAANGQVIMTMMTCILDKSTVLCYYLLDLHNGVERHSQKIRILPTCC